MAVDSETRWMIQQAGGTTTPSPSLTVTTNLAASGGFAKTTTPASATFSGIAEAAATASVKVNGIAATFNAGTGAWSLANTTNRVGLRPGINRVQVRSYNANSVEVTRKTVDVWYDDASVVTIANNTVISAPTTWTAAGGPYLVSGLLTIADGGSLTIQPGTSVYFNNRGRLLVEGTLDAQGTDFQHVRFTRNPTSPSNWAHVDLQTSQATRLKYLDVEYAANTTGVTDTGTKNVSEAIRSEGGSLYMDHVTFGNMNRQFLDVVGSSLDIRNTVFPTINQAQEPIHGTNMLGTAGSFAIFDHNVHGKTKGYQDVVDFSGGNRPGSILRVQNSWFLGGEDDGLDLDSTDVWIENNVFMNFHQPNGRTTPESKSHPISTGNENGTSELTIVRNYFYDNDHAVCIKDGGQATIVNNTIVNVHSIPDAGPNDATTGVFNLYEPRSGQYPGTRLHIEGNIIRDVSRMFEVPQPFPSGHTGNVAVTFRGNFIPADTTIPQAGVTFDLGAGNPTADPLLTAETNVIDPTTAFVLQPGSPAKGAGPNGVDAGAVVKTGVSLSGEPPAITNLKTATLTPGFLFGTGTNAAGYTAYKYRLNNGAYSAERPTTTPITLTNLADGTYTVFALGRADDGTWQTEADVTASKTWVVDTRAPRVVSTAFDYASAANTVKIVFDEDVGASLAMADVALKDTKTGLPIDPAKLALAYDAATKTATLSFPGFGGRLPDGDYGLTLKAAGVTDPAGNALDGNANGTGGDDLSFSFFQLTGDADRNRTVDFQDLVKLAQNYNTTGKTWAEGDFNADGKVDFQDLVLLSQKYNTGLGTEPAPAMPVAAAPAPMISAEIVGASRTTLSAEVSQTDAAAPKPKAAARPAFSTRRVR